MGLASDMMKAVLKDSGSTTAKRRKLPVSMKSKSMKSVTKGFRNRNLSKQELAIQFAKDLLVQGHHLQHMTALERLSSALAGSGRSLINPHFTPSPLSSASLLGSFIKNRLVRNQESVTPAVIRRIVGFGDSKNPIWNHSTSQAARNIQFTQSLERLNLQKESLKLQIEFFPENEYLSRQLSNMSEIIKRTETMMKNLEPVVTGNLHPDSLLSGDKVSMTPSEAAQLPSPLGTVRGVLIRLKGPRKGNRALKQQKSSGRVSINSIGYVVHEECSIQLPSKLGIFGLYIRFVYSKTDRLISPHSNLNVLGYPGFKFKSII